MDTKNQKPKTKDLLLDDFFAYLTIEKGRSPETITAYRRDLRKMEEWMQGSDLDVLTMTWRDLREFQMMLAYDGLSPRSVSRTLSGVSGFFSYLFVEGIIAHNPCDELIRPQFEQSIPRFLNFADTVRLITSGENDTERAIMGMMYASGLRVSEVIRLRVADVDINKGIVTAMGKGSKPRKVPFSLDQAGRIAVMLDHRQHRRHSPLFMIGGVQPTRQDVWRIVKAAAKRVGLDNVYPHTLRHSFATHLSQRGVDVRHIQQMLGHESINTTEIYTHITSDDLKERYKKFHPRS